MTIPFTLARRVVAMSVLSATALFTCPARNAEAQVEQPGLAATRCTALASLNLPDTIIASATVAPAISAAAAVKGVPATPAFCRVVAHVRAAADSDVAVEVWLPLERWTGVFHGNGNGGFAGVLQAGYPGMVAGLLRGYATATSDTGTAPATPLDGAALIGHPRKWRDWGRLSTHAMTVTGKAITAAFYREAARRAFYTGCSTGGQQGLIEALYYPEDYDGIVVGAPVINRTWGHAAVLWDYAAAHRAPGRLLSDDKLALLNRAAIAQCARQGHGLPGDAFVADPLACRFDPAAVACKAGQRGACLSPGEVSTARAFYSGPTHGNGKPAFFGWLPGSEGLGRFGWSFLQSENKGQPQFGALFNWVFGADWSWRSFEVDGDMRLVDAKLGGIVNNATSGSLQAFAKRGGKLIIYHGLADTLVPPAQSLAFYRRQVRQLGGPAQASRSLRLFLAPGMQHCAGGTGADSFNSAIGGAAPPVGAGASEDLFYAITSWRDGLGASNEVVATKFAEDRAEIAFQRPVCAFPMQATYRGRGARTQAASYVCALPRR